MMRGPQPWRTNRARVLRDQSTSAEDRMWAELRARRFLGLKFVRQMPIGPCFADFACRERRIVVEIDGETHSTAAELVRDEVRDRMLAAQGYRIFRVHNAEVFEDIDGVLISLRAFIDGELK